MAVLDRLGAIVPPTRQPHLATLGMLAREGLMGMPERLVIQAALATQAVLAPMAIQATLVPLGQVLHQAALVSQALPRTPRTRTNQSSCERHILCRSPHLGKS